MKTGHPTITRLLADHLDPGERVEHAVGGRHRPGLRRPKAYLVATDRRLIFYGTKLVGFDIASVTYHQLSGLGVSTTTTGRHVMVGGIGTGIAINRVKDPDFVALERYVRERMAA